MILDTIKLSVAAQGGQIAPGCGFKCNYNDLITLVNNYIETLIEIATFIFLLGIIAVGVNLILKGGSAKNLEKTKGHLITLLTGYLLLLGAFLIIDLVFTVLGSKEGGLEDLL